MQISLRFCTFQYEFTQDLSVIAIIVGLKGPLGLNGPPGYPGTPGMKVRSLKTPPLAILKYIKVDN